MKTALPFVISFVIIVNSCGRNLCQPSDRQTLLQSARVSISELAFTISKSGYRLKDTASTIVFTPIGKSPIGKKLLDVNWIGCQVQKTEIEKQRIMADIRNINSDTSLFIISHSITATKEKEIALANICILPLSFCNKKTTIWLDKIINLPFECDDAYANDVRFFKTNKFFIIVDFDRHSSLSSYNEIFAIMRSFFMSISN